LFERRRVLQLGLGAVASAVASATLGKQAWAEACAPMAPRELAFHNLHTGERLQALYWDKGAYVPDALAAVNKVLRDHNNGQEHAIDARLLDLLSTLSGKLDAKSAPYQVICGYRSPATNAALHSRSEQVAAHSLHMSGMAIDIRIDGVELAHLQKAALDLKDGGVGIYPRSDFVHVDVGRVRRWQGT
jgi:uncharacterized protein YcbK (DUF882 family)